MTVVLAIQRTGVGVIRPNRRVVLRVERGVEWIELECRDCGLTPIMFFSTDNQGYYKTVCQWCDPWLNKNSWMREHSPLARIKQKEKVDAISGD